jgi:FecR protein
MSHSKMSSGTTPNLHFRPVVLAALACALLALPALADSQARIVRLSDVHGSVQIDKNTGMGFESAFLNLPITQGTQIRTRDNGRAEVEFEDGSTLRLAPNTLVVFDTLGLNDAGTRTSTVNLANGMAYVNWFGKKGDQFALSFSQEKIELDHAAHFRVHAVSAGTQVAVFKGDVAVAVEGEDSKVTVAKNKMASFDGGDKPEIAGITANAFDDWDKEALTYHDQYAKNNTSPYGFGSSDLSYYGSYQNMAGYGMMWQPYFAGVGWNPFMDGAWSWYPGMGYTFVSAYPWGWQPFHYGSWMFITGAGWMWQPGAWNSYGVVPRVTGTLPANFRTPVVPTSTFSTVVVGRGGPVLTSSAPSRVLNNGTAGIGIARGSLPNLNHLNHQVAKSGSAEVRPAPQFAASSPRTGFGQYGGSRPSSGSSGSSRASAPSYAPSSSAGSAGHGSAGGGHH